MSVFLARLKKKPNPAWAVLPLFDRTGWMKPQGGLLVAGSPKRGCERAVAKC